MNDPSSNRLAKTPIVAILRGVKPREAPAIGDALIDSGVRAIEVPLNSPYPFESIGRLTNACAGNVLVGAGTVLRAEDVKQVADRGGELIVSPNADADVIRATLDLGLISMPGVFSASEAFSAVKLGARALKIFPAGRLGPAYIRDLKAVLPEEVALFAVGGVNRGNVVEWFRAGVRGVGIGSAIYSPGDTPANVARRVTAFVRTANMHGDSSHGHVSD